MIGVSKKFDRTLYELADKTARDITKPLIKRLFQFDCEDNPDKYGVDLLAYKDGTLVNFVECELSGVWDNEPFPYEFVRLPERKGKFTNLMRPTYFVMINRTRTKAIVYSSDKVKISSLREVSNFYNRTGEFFFHIPKSEVMEVDLIDSK